MQNGNPALIEIFSERPNRFSSLSALLERAKLSAGARILEVGCGDGAAAAHLAFLGYFVTAADADENLVEAARKKYAEGKNLSFITADATCLPFEPNSFDCIVSEAAFSVIREKSTTAAEYSRLLTPEGLVLFCDFALREPMSGTFKSGIPCFDGVQTPDSYAAIFKASGFSETFREDAFFDFAAFVNWLCTRFDTRPSEVGALLSELFGGCGNGLGSEFTKGLGLTWCRFIFSKEVSL